MLRHVLLISLTLGVALGHDDLLKRYGQKKIYESCFGKSLMEKKYKEFYSHVAACKNESAPMAIKRKGFDWEAALSNSGSEDSPIYLPVPIITQGRKSFFFNKRQKRHALFDEAKLRKLKNAVIKKLKLASCVLQRMDIFDKDMNMQWNELEMMYSKDYGFEMELAEDLMETFKKCKQFVMCMPFGDKSGGFPVGLKQMMYFKKCEMKKKTAACIKKDLRSKPEMFELEGLDGMLDHYEDDDEKMLKVMKLFHKYGDSDLDFFYN